MLKCMCFVICMCQWLQLTLTIFYTVLCGWWCREKATLSSPQHCVHANVFIYILNTTLFAPISLHSSSKTTTSDVFYAHASHLFVDLRTIITTNSNKRKLYNHTISLCFKLVHFFVKIWTSWRHVLYIFSSCFLLLGQTNWRHPKICNSNFVFICVSLFNFWYELQNDYIELIQNLNFKCCKMRWNQTLVWPMAMMNCVRKCSKNFDIGLMLWLHQIFMYFWTLVKANRFITMINLLVFFIWYSLSTLFLFLSWILLIFFNVKIQ